ncbi:MAG: TonB-dependent receptor [Proteobacteria bacterium]|nr:TonB-dependent receptor [Pseudomonadota bacterium]
MRYYFITGFTLFSVLQATSAMAQDAPNTLKEVVVTANPLGRSAEELTQPVTVLSGNELRDKAEPTLGETLSQELGIRSTYFGPNASRPVIRGLDGDQIQMLQNGLSNLDASATSVDHNVSIEPLSVERIEVVRGPAALLYGPKAVGGVVNVIDNRIPDARIPEKITGTVDGRYDSANDGRTGSLLLEGGSGDYAWHVNGFARRTDDLEIPGFARSERQRRTEPLDPGEEEAKNKLPNSQSNSHGGSVGVTKFFDAGHFGVALTDYNTDYGTVAEPDVTIGMDQQRIDFAGAFDDAPLPHVKAIKYKLGLSDYDHTEFEGAEPGTTFKNRGYDSRVEVVHEKLGLFEGAVGIQSEANDFSALGEEAFLPPTLTRMNSAFIFEEVPLGKLRLQIGGRVDDQKVSADSNSTFGPGSSRNDLTGSASTGFIYHPVPAYAVALSGSYTERAPNAQELYANGPHLATDAFEIGDPSLDVQRSVGLDLSFRKELGTVTGEVNFFYNRFQNFITAAATGAIDPTFDVPVYAYGSVPAEFYGAEAKADFTAYEQDNHKLGLEVRSDYVEARNRDTGEPLPRIAPLRIGGSTIYHYNQIGVRMDADYTFNQDRVAPFESPTDGYTMLNAGVDYTFNTGPSSSTLYLKATNLLDEEARDHVSFLKDIAPLAGRAVMIGVRNTF